MRKFVVFILWLVVLAGCGGSDDPATSHFTTSNVATGGSGDQIADEDIPKRNGVSEKDFVEELGLTLLPGQVGLFLMEPDQAIEGSIDSGEHGVDTFPFSIQNPGQVLLRFDSNLSGIVSLITLRDANGAELAQLASLGTSASVFLSPGTYTVELDSADGRPDEENRAVFAVFSGPLSEISSQETVDLNLDFTAEVENKNLDALDLRGQEVRDLNVTNCSLRGADWRNARLLGLMANGADLTGLRADGIIIVQGLLNFADLSEADLQRAIIGQTAALEAKLIGANLDSAKFTICVLADADFEGADATLTKFITTVMPKVSFRNATFGDTTFVNCALMNADFTGSNTTEAIFIQSDLTGATVPKG